MEVLFSNFRCLKDARLRLTPLTILVGENASGKSAALQALDPRLEIWDRDVSQRRPKLHSTIDRRTGPNAGIRTHSRPGSNSTLETYGGAPIYAYQKLHLDLTQLRQPNQLSEDRTLAETGSNLANVFHTLPRPTQEELSKHFTGLVPVFSDVDTRGSGRPGYHRLVFQDRWNQEIWYDPHEVSDGSMLVLALLLVPYQSPPTEVLAIEEPDRGLHPYLLEKVVELLRRLARGEFGKGPKHVVLTTHSPGLLEFAEPEEVRFFKRDASDGSVRIEEPPTGDPEWQRAFKEYSQSLGSVWLSGAMGGVPGG